MDKLDKAILDIIQTDFPLVPRPYAAIGQKLGVSEEEVFARVQALQKQGIIRRIGANFQSRKLGWFSTLCAAKVPAEKLDEFVQVVNSYPGVTHNYLRKHELNVWFTFISPSEEQTNQYLDEIHQKTGIKVYSLPATKMFKIRVDFPMQREDE